jgi:hypothetical protein
VASRREADRPPTVLPEELRTRPCTADEIRRWVPADETPPPSGDWEGWREIRACYRWLDARQEWLRAAG